MRLDSIDRLLTCPQPIAIGIHSDGTYWNCNGPDSWCAKWFCDSVAFAHQIKYLCQAWSNWRRNRCAWFAPDGGHSANEFSFYLHFCRKFDSAHPNCRPHLDTYRQTVLHASMIAFAVQVHEPMPPYRVVSAVRAYHICHVILSPIPNIIADCNRRAATAADDFPPYCCHNKLTFWIQPAMRHFENEVNLNRAHSPAAVCYRRESRSSSHGSAAQTIVWPHRKRLDALHQTNAQSVLLTAPLRVNWMTCHCKWDGKSNSFVQQKLIHGMTAERRTGRHSLIFQFDQFHVKDFNRLETLHNRIENQSNAI